MAEGSGSGWLKGCAIGCAIFVLLVIAAVVGIYMFLSHSARQGAIETSKQAHAHYESVLAEIEAPELDLSSLDALHTHSQREGLNPSATMLSSITILSILDDKEVTKEEIAVADEIAELLENEPNPNAIKVFSWLGSHPELQQKLQQLQQQHGRVIQTEVHNSSIEEAPVAVEENTLPEEASPVLEIEASETEEVFPE